MSYEQSEECAISVVRTTLGYLSERSIYIRPGLPIFGIVSSTCRIVSEPATLLS
jgi:hypothetical protein